MSKDVTPKEAAGLLTAASKILILAHEKPDGDAVGSAFGLEFFLRSLGKEAMALFSAPLPRRYEGFWTPRLTRLTPDEAKTFDLVVVLDSANRQRIASGEELPYEELAKLPLLNVDHHGGNDIDAGCRWVDPTAAAASLQIAEIAWETGQPVPPEAATAWLLGLFTDTGSFRFSNADGRAFRAAARLLDEGADIETVTNTLYFSKPRNQQAFEAELLQNEVRFACGDRFVYAVLPEALLQKYDFDMKEGEGLIDLLREIDGTVIAALLYRRGGNWKISLRSKLGRYPVGPAARSLGGGGHELAAGITLSDRPEEEAVALLLATVQRIFEES